MQATKADPVKPSVKQFDDLPDDALIDVESIARLTGLGVSTTWRKVKTDPRFPALVRLGKRCTRARVGDVRRYLRGE